MNLHRHIPRLGALTLAAGLGLGLYLGAPQPAAGFCGFYVAGADAELFADATMVVLMRDGTRTVLSMQNNYQGPPEDFALVIPVPVVLGEDDVKTLEKAVFAHVDALAAPRLVEYWEQDPCEARRREREAKRMVRRDEERMVLQSAPGSGDYGVTVEAEFAVGEYDIVILSAEDSTGLDTWLRASEYNIPEGAAPVLQPYVESGMKFFVAKVDPQKISFAAGPDGVSRAQLSPLRFHYDTDTFSLPIRLGLINANGPQDLLVHILAPDQRYEVANYGNVTIPTNLVVKDSVREHFGEFYVSLFDHTLAQNPGAVVTEYAWSASSCDPCPEPPLELGELIVLGADVLPRYADGFDDQGQLKPDSDVQWKIGSEMTLTRLHARYDKASLGEDLVFATAEGLEGGRGMPKNGQLNPKVTTSSVSNFQGRYVILHYWDGAVKCMRPLWDQWGGPPSASDVPPGGSEPAVARDLAFVNRDAALSSYVTRATHETLKLEGEAPSEDRPKRVVKAIEKAAGKSGCACSSASADGDRDQDRHGLGLMAAGLVLGALGRRRRRAAASSSSTTTTSSSSSSTSSAGTTP